MVFSSIVFLCAFLPIVLVLDRCLRSTTHRNIALTVASVVFYAYGEPRMVVLLLLSCGLNYVLGRLVEPGRPRRREYLIAGIVCNLLLLVVFKYLSMIVGTINAILRTDIVMRDIPLPLGISFYTFQALSYVIDVYRGDVACQKTFYKVLLYISFFPQLVAGPIVKYHDFDYQIDNRHASVNDMATGLRRFGLGLAKKVLLADVFASCADALFALPKDQLFAPAAWLAAFAYMMQIYMDFSAYSDMAIGMAAALGFRIPENFRHPYASLSMREFWRRWHISLSGWFREYLYIPLGGNRLGRKRAIINRFIVFALCGLWHGANWTFVVWGLLHGLALFFEEYVDVDGWSQRARRAYVLLFVLFTFVIFRSDTLGDAVYHLRQMLFGWGLTSALYIPFVSQLNPLFLVAVVVALLISGTLPERIVHAVQVSNKGAFVDSMSYLLTLGCVFLCLLALASGTYSPFIYFRF